MTKFARKFALRAACLATVFALAALTAQAQVCTIDPVTVAQMISPTNGSTLQPNPDGSITFTWCNASADYFVVVESILGAHDIFFAFTGGAGGGAGQNFLTLGPTCNIPTATNPTTQCIPSNGETIHFTLQTVKNKQILGSFQYTFTAPGQPPASRAATTTSAGNASATSSSSAQSVMLTATVAAASAVNQGTVTFQVMSGTTNLGAAVTSAPLTSGSATVSYLLPAGTPAGSYPIQASYSGGANFQPSSSTSGTLTVAAAPVAPAATTTTVANQSATFSSLAQNVTLTANVSAASAVNEGTVTFQVRDAASNPVGSAASSATLASGSASAIYTLPAGLSAAGYTIQATYSGGSNFAASSSTGTLTVNALPPPNQTATVTLVSNNAVSFSSGLQHVTLTAAVVPGAPAVILNEGTVTFTVMDGTANVAVPSAPLTDGNASVSYALPAGLAANATGYTIKAEYSGGADFLASSGTGTLTIAKAGSTTSFTSAAPASLPNHGTYTPTATSTGDGTLTIAASGACSIAGGVVTINATSGTCTVTATESEGANFLGSSAMQTITAKPSSAPDNYTMGASTTSLTVKSGQSGSVQITLTPSTAFDGTVTFNCSGMPANARCQFTPAQFAGSLDGKPLTTTLVVSGNLVAALNRSNPVNRRGGLGSLLAFGCLGAGAIGMVFAGGEQVRRRTRWFKRCSRLWLGCAVWLVLLAGCGGGSHPTTPTPAPQTFSAVVTASFASSQPAPNANQQVQIQITIVP